MEPPKPLIVPDADTLDQFESNAREAWYERHPDKKGQRGRRYDPRIIEAVKENFKSHPSRKRSQNARVRDVLEAIRTKFGEEKLPSPDAVLRYVRMFVTFRRALENGQRLSRKEMGWLGSNFPASQGAIDHITDALVAIIPALSKMAHDMDQLRSALRQHGIDTASKKFDRFLLKLVNLFSNPS